MEGISILILFHRFSVDSTVKAPKKVQVPGAGHSDELCHMFR